MTIVLVKDMHGEELSAEEDMRLHAFCIMGWRGVEAVYVLVERGTLEQDFLTSRVDAAGTLLTVRGYERWKRVRGHFISGFARYVDGLYEARFEGGLQRPTVSTSIRGAVAN